MTARPHVVLVGPMGSGKTTVGRQLGARLGRRFVDNDEALHLATGRTAAEIQAADGRAELHRAELDALRQALAVDAPAVVAAAASVVDTDTGRSLLRETACVVWLQASPEQLVDRYESSDHRPPAPADASAREPHFAAVATVAVDALAPVEAIVGRVLDEC